MSNSCDFVKEEVGRWDLWGVVVWFVEDALKLVDLWNKKIEDKICELGWSDFIWFYFFNSREKSGGSE